MRSQPVGSVLRSTRRWVSERTDRNIGEPSFVALDIAQLISPLRLDVLVRASLFETWAADWDALKSHPDAALAVAEKHPYRGWFDLVAKDKITGGTGRSADDAFAWRVRRSHALLARYIQDGFDERHPITVKMHPGGRLPSGKSVGPRLYPVDGCHRLALLWVDGARMLAPSQYRLLSDQSPPRDNTAALVSFLQLSDTDYFSYIGSGYGVPSASNRSDLLGGLSTNDPRRNELVSVLDADEALR